MELLRPIRPSVALDLIVSPQVELSMKESVSTDVIAKGTTATAQCYDVGGFHVNEDAVQ
jgi:hypothetical protein